MMDEKEQFNGNLVIEMENLHVIVKLFHFSEFASINKRENTMCLKSTKI